MLQYFVHWQGQESNQETNCFVKVEDYHLNQTIGFRVLFQGGESTLRKLEAVVA